MGWVAVKQQKVKRDDGYVWVLPGEPIPEADKWPNRQAWVNMKSIKWVDGPADSTGPPAPAQGSTEPPTTPAPDATDTGPTGATDRLTEEFLDGLGRKEITSIGSERFGLKLSARSSKGKLIAAVLGAQQEA